MFFRPYLSNVFSMVSKFYIYVQLVCSTHIFNGLGYRFMAVHISSTVYECFDLGFSIFLLFSWFAKTKNGQIRKLDFYMNFKRFFIFLWNQFFRFSCFHINLQCILLCLCRTEFQGKTYGSTVRYIFPTVLLCFSRAAYKSNSVNNCLWLFFFNLLFIYFLL